MDYFSVPGLIDTEERELLQKVTVLAVKQFGTEPVLVNLGVFLGASCYALRAGSLTAKLFGVDINGWDRLQDTPELRAVLNMPLIQGDSRVVVKDFQKPIHVLFVDDVHNFDFVDAHCKAWAQMIP